MDYFEDVQITCCNDNFLIGAWRGIMIIFTCPNCKAAATLRDIIINKKLRENNQQLKSLLSECTGSIPGSTQPTTLVKSNIPTLIKTLQAQITVFPQTIRKTSLAVNEPTNKKLDVEEKIQLYSKINE